MIPRNMKIFYDAYITSQKWREIREKAIQSTYWQNPVHDPDWGHYYCEYCRWNFHKNELEVHHLTYDSLGNEARGDIAVVCSCCHEKLDKVRARKGEQNSREALYEARFNGWATKVYGDEWHNTHDPSDLHDEFCEWLEGRPDD